MIKAALLEGGWVLRARISEQNGAIDAAWFADVITCAVDNV